MKRILCSLLLVFCLVAGLCQPIFATQETSEADQASNLVETNESALQAGQQTRASETYAASQEGLAFIGEMTAGNYSAQQLAKAEEAVNQFISSYSLDLSQQQFDALVDFSVEYGDKMFTSGYQCEKVIAAGDYTDATLASAFCSWVRDGSGSFSQKKLDRRLRQIKLFLYGSYDGVCAANFRYVVFHGNGGNLNDNTVLCYTLGSTYGALPTASRSGSYFAGWYTASAGGIHLVNSDEVTINQTVYAQWSATEVASPNEGGDSSGSENSGNNWPELPQLNISEAGIQFIKDHEGFLSYPTYDYGQYSVGYGSRYDTAACPIPISSPITEAEADYLLRYLLADFEALVDKHLQNASVKHTQAQYDMIVSLTYNLGQQWMKSDYKIYQYILHGGHSEMEFVNTLGKWCNAGGTVLTGLARRRIDESNLYIHSDYTHNSDEYLFIQFNGAKGTAADKYRYYKTGEALGELTTASRDGYRLTGWYDKTSGGNRYTEDTLAPACVVQTLYAQWELGEDPQPDTNPAPDDGNSGSDFSGTDSGDTSMDSTPDQEQTPDFSDVSPNAWYYSYVIRAVEAGLFSGMSETSFAPEGTMTRAMLATVLYRIAGQPDATKGAPFTDVPSGRWYSEAIDWAYENGIVNGISETKFGLESNVTREQLTTMLQRYAKYLGYNTDTNGSLGAFSDADSVSAFAEEAMCWAVACKIMNGDGGFLNPQGNATRAQCAKILVCFLDLYGENENNE